MPVISAILSAIVVEFSLFCLFTFTPHLVGIHSEELLKLLRRLG